MKRYIILTLLLLGMVSGQVQTCVQSVTDGVCVEYAPDECASQCQGTCVPTPSDNIPDCALGYCVSPTTGMCDQQVPHITCEALGGVWSATPLVQCNLGCCQSAEGVLFNTEAACTQYSDITGVDTTWQGGLTEQECLVLNQVQEEGACLFENEFEPNECSFTSTSECASLGGQFYPGYLCTHPDLGTDYEKQATTGCVDGRDEVFWFDSEGNRENVYDANKVRSFNDGFLQSTPECDLALANDPLGNQATCGACQRVGSFVSTTCGTPTPGDAQPAEGSFVCRDLTCTDDQGNTRQHGESWCAYEGVVGFAGESNDGRSRDVPGSSHYRMVCNNGEVVIDQCQTARREICIESQVTGQSNADCRINAWQQCVFYNSEPDTMVEDCTNDAYCSLKEVAVDSGFAFSRCVPRFPPGFIEGNTRSEVSAESLCSLASQSCVISYQKRSLGGGYRCIKNCNCRGAIFTQTMNNFCTSLGDCGAAYNVAGTYTDTGMSFAGKAPPPTQEYIDALGLIEAEEGAYIDAAGFEIKDNAAITENLVREINQMPVSADGLHFGEWDRLLFAWEEYLSNLGNPIDFVNALWTTAWGNIFGGFGEGKTRYATFECLPWDAPRGGDDCSACDDNGLGCTEYKCSTLGNCEFLFENEGIEGAPLCVANDVNDVNPPVISPGTLEGNQPYEYVNVGPNGFTIQQTDGSCLEEYSAVTISVATDEVARCRISAEPGLTYSSMEHFGTPNYLLEQSETVPIPSLSSLYLDTPIPDDVGDYTLYMRCTDRNGNGEEVQEYAINYCISEGLDLEPAEIGPFVPETGAVGFEAENYNFLFYVGEPAECRWDTQDLDYSLMQHEAVCATDFFAGTLQGWPCIVQTPVEDLGPTLYVRCLDQPWIDDPDFEATVEGAARNANQQSQTYDVDFSTSPLVIEVVNPTGDEPIVTGAPPAIIDLEITTSGGLNGNAQCEVSFNGGVQYTPFFTTGGSTHEYNNLQAYDQGDYTYDMQCIDTASNEANASVTFTAIVDTAGPTITRAYELNGLLHVITNEPGDCSYSLGSCTFAFDDGLTMSSFDMEHTTAYEQGLTKYVKCQDEFENIGQCVALGGGYA